MLEHAVKVSIRERFEIKIGENSKAALKLQKKSIFEIAKVGAISSFIKAKIYNPFKTYLTDQGRLNIRIESSYTAVTGRFIKSRSHCIP